MKPTLGIFALLFVLIVGGAVFWLMRPVGSYPPPQGATLAEQPLPPASGGSSVAGDTASVTTRSDSHRQADLIYQDDPVGGYEERRESRYRPMREEPRLNLASRWLEGDLTAPSIPNRWRSPWPGFNDDLRSIEENKDERQRMRQMISLIKQFAGENPRDAVAFALDYPEPIMSDTLHYNAVSEWALRQPTQALAYASELAGESQSRWFNAILYGLGPEHPQDAFELATVLGPTHAARTLPNFTAWAAQRNDPAEVASWLAQADLEPTLATSSQLRLVEVWAQREPADALSWAQGNGLLREPGMSTNLARGWAQQNALAAAHWSTQRRGEEGDAALNAVMQVWFKESPGEADAWLSSQDSSLQTPSRIETATRSLSTTEPARATTWALSHPDPSRQRQLLASVAREWYRNDREEYQFWYQNADLPENLRGAIPKP